jgi:hypothetical protein
VDNAPLEMEFNINAGSVFDMDGIFIWFNAKPIVFTKKSFLMMPTLCPNRCRGYQTNNNQHQKKQLKHPLLHYLYSPKKRKNNNCDWYCQSQIILLKFAAVNFTNADCNAIYISLK